MSFAEKTLPHPVATPGRGGRAGVLLALAAALTAFAATVLRRKARPRCAECGHPLPRRAPYCPTCGEGLPAPPS